MGPKRYQDALTMREHIAQLVSRLKIRLTDRWQASQFTSASSGRKTILATVIFCFLLATAAAYYFADPPLSWTRYWKISQTSESCCNETIGAAACPACIPDAIPPEECLMPIISTRETSRICCENQQEDCVPSSSWSWGKFFSKPCQPVPCPSRAPWPKRLTLSSIVGNQGRIDHSTNYSSASLLFGPEYRCGGCLPLFDLQGHRFSDTTNAATAGLIFRYIPSIASNMEEILGLNFYYDYRQGSLGYYQQCSVGLEILADRWELRANGYIPFGNKKSFEICDRDDRGFRRVKRDHQKVSYGFNAELGAYPVKTCSFLMYLAAGPYSISGRPCKLRTIGVEARIRPQYKDYFALDLSYNWDPLFLSVFQAEFIFYIPLYQFSKRRPIGNCARGLTLRQIYQNVERFDVMPLGRRTCKRSRGHED